MGYPTSCSICLDKKANAILGELALSVKPFRPGDNPSIMLVGLNPTLKKKMKRVKTVLDLDNVEGNFYKFTVSDVLEPVGIALEDVYATNLIKCTFRDEPRDISKDIRGSDEDGAVKQLLAPFFHHCKRYLMEELREVNPRLVIAFGNKTHQFIVEEFNLEAQGVKYKMKDAFGHVYRVSVLGRNVCYAPCIREAAKGLPVFQKSWQPFIRGLRES